MHTLLKAQWYALDCRWADGRGDISWKKMCSSYVPSWMKGHLIYKWRWVTKVPEGGTKSSSRGDFRSAQVLVSIFWDRREAQDGCNTSQGKERPELYPFPAWLTDWLCNLGGLSVLCSFWTAEIPEIQLFFFFFWLIGLEGLQGLYAWNWTHYISLKTCLYFFISSLVFGYLYFIQSPKPVTGESF